MRTTKIFCDACGVCINLHGDNENDFHLILDNWHCDNQKVTFSKDLCDMCANQVLRYLKAYFKEDND